MVKHSGIAGAEVAVVFVVAAEVDVFVSVAPEVVAGLIEGDVAITALASARSSGAACANALQYAAGEVLTVLLNPKPPDRIGNVREIRASFGRVWKLEFC